MKVTNVTDEDILAPGLLEFDEGCLSVPDRPGLGIELDKEMVVRHAGGGR